MNQEHLAIASVPMQSWNTTLEPENAMLTGTIFPELNMPFFVTEESGLTANEFQSLSKENTPMASGDAGREEMLLRIQEISFVLDDVRLFMDTHPDDKNGLELLKSALKERTELLKVFALKFYPLTVDCMTHIYQSNPEFDCNCWQEGPMPWEGACV